MSAFGQCGSMPLPFRSVSAASERAYPEANDEDTNWYIARVNARHEKSVARMLGSIGLVTFLPVAKRTHAYGRRLRQYEVPLFPGYVFCHLPTDTTSYVAQFPSVFDLVGFGGRPSVVPDAEVNSLRRAASADVVLQPWPYLEAGNEIRVTHGPLSGITGVLLDRTANSTRVILSVNLLHRSVLVDIGRLDVEKLPEEV